MVLALLDVTDVLTGAPVFERFSALSDVTFARFAERTGVPIELLMLIREATGIDIHTATDLESLRAAVTSPGGTTAAAAIRTRTSLGPGAGAFGLALQEVRAFVHQKAFGVRNEIEPVVAQPLGDPLGRASGQRWVRIDPSVERGRSATVAAAASSRARTQASRTPPACTARAGRHPARLRRSR